MSARAEVVVFDVGGTLIDPWPSVGHVYAEVAGWHGVTGMDPARLTAQFLEAWREKGEFDYTRAAWRKLVERTFAGAVGEAGRVEVGTFFDALYDYFGEAAPWRIYEDVTPALSLLREEGFRLAVLSNWDERLRPLLDRLGLSGFFEVTVVSSEVGMTKPALGIFREMEVRLGCSPGRLWHVGDSRVEDWEGAGRAGWRRVWLRRGGAGPAGDLRAVAMALAEGREPGPGH